MFNQQGPQNCICFSSALEEVQLVLAEAFSPSLLTSEFEVTSDVLSLMHIPCKQKEVILPVAACPSLKVDVLHCCLSPQIRDENTPGLLSGAGVAAIGAAVALVLAVPDDTTASLVWLLQRCSFRCLLLLTMDLKTCHNPTIVLSYQAGRGNSLHGTQQLRASTVRAIACNVGKLYGEGLFPSTTAPFLRVALHHCALPEPPQRI
eukprot:1158304-Pelagomonas_calceolata.AAC.2